MNDSTIVELRTARLYRITGKVQGVWFRDSTRRQALELDISGYAINLDEGDVEVYAVGKTMHCKYAVIDEKVVVSSTGALELGKIGSAAFDHTPANVEM